VALVEAAPPAVGAGVAVALVEAAPPAVGAGVAVALVEAAPPAVAVVVGVALISAGGTPPERSSDSKTLAWSPCRVASSSVSAVDEPPSPAARSLNHRASRCASSRASSSGIGWRVGRSGLRGASFSSRTRHPDSAVKDPTVNATKSDLRDQMHGIRSFTGMGSMMARPRAVAVSTAFAPID
ncbi:MAG: hypothetical protein ACYDC9_09235, partial [Dermatophilaceae bacterium]